MDKTGQKINSQDITALENVFELIKEYLDKNPIRKNKVNIKRINSKLLELKNIPIQDTDRVSKLFKGVLKKIKVLIKKEIIPEIYLILGGHGGIIIDDVPYCEFDSPEYALEKLIEKMELALQTEMPYNIEIAIYCFYWLKTRMPEKVEQFIELFKKGRFEIINPTFSQPYNLIIGPESNIKQFEFGLKILKDLGLKSNMYYCSEASLHPQIPQILKGFGIEFCSLRTRLLGQCPSTPSGSIYWAGLDGTKIKTITDQYGIYNGEYWHGTFLKELPNLLFQAVSRPFLQNIIYSSIEDFIMPVFYLEDLWIISKFDNVFGNFVLCSDLFELIETNGEYKFNRDQFTLGNYIFNRPELFLNNKKCEINIITAEILNSILFFYKNESNDSLLNELWQKLLLTQAHDVYAVPFIRPGDYSATQLSKSEYEKLEIDSPKISIADLSIKLQEDIIKNCENYTHEIMNELIEFFNQVPSKNNTPDDLPCILVFNPSIYTRTDIYRETIKLKNYEDYALKDEDNNLLEFNYENSTLEFIPNLAPLKFKLYSLIKKKGITSNSDDFIYDIDLSVKDQELLINYRGDLIYKLKFDLAKDLKLTEIKKSKNKISMTCLISCSLKDCLFKIKVKEYRGINRLEFQMSGELLKEIILTPNFKIFNTFLNYPFGIEETHCTEVQTLDFLWLKGHNLNIVFMQNSSQRFVIDRRNNLIKNLVSYVKKYEFAISVLEKCTSTIVNKYVEQYHFKPIGIVMSSEYNKIKLQDTFLSIQPPVQLINLWSRNNKIYFRIFNPSNKLNRISVNGLITEHKIKEISLNYQEINKVNKNDIIFRPWEIKTFEILINKNY